MSETEADWDVAVVGAGAAGIFAATEAAARGARTLLLEKNRRPGVKILASGGSKCNVTSTLPIDQLGSWFGRRAERFLRHGLHTFGPHDVRRLLDEEGVPTDEFPLEKVFPKSFRAGDVLRAFLRRLDRSGATLLTDAAVRGVRRDEDRFHIETTTESFTASRLIVTSGGRSYPKTGCTGDGYAWLESLGHTIKPTRPALVPLVVENESLRALTGIARPDVVVSALDARGRATFARRRPLLFTHRGLSGPGPMDVSGHLNRADGPRRLAIDWLPDVPADELTNLLQSPQGKGATVASVLPGEMPRRLAEALLGAAAIPASRRCSQLRRGERTALVEVMKKHVLEVARDEGWDKAEVTAGGVSLDEIDPRTMASRRVPGLHVAGEILDVDGPIGGFNFQAAFSTAVVAGIAASKAD